MIPIELEIEIFKKFSKMQDIMNYANTNKYRQNILDTHKQFILVKNKLLQHNDFINWFYIIVTVNMTEQIYKKQYMYCIYYSINKISYLLKTREYSKIVKIFKQLNKYPHEDLRNIIRTSKTEVYMNLHKLYNSYDTKLIRSILDFYRIYFLDENTSENNYTSDNYKKYNKILLNLDEGYTPYINKNDMMIFMILYEYVRVRKE
jgi:hypothetical protein